MQAKGERLLDAHGDSLGGFLGEFEDGEGFGVVGVAGAAGEEEGAASGVEGEVHAELAVAVVERPFVVVEVAARE